MNGPGGTGFSLRGDTRRLKPVPPIALVVGFLLALIGAGMGIAPLFLHGWVRVRASFSMRQATGAQVLRRLGVDVDAPIAAIANTEIARVVPPTLWEVKNHAFQVVAALLALAVALLLVATLARGGQRRASGAALLAVGAAAIVLVVALVKIRTKFDGLPEMIRVALDASGVLKQVTEQTTGTPQVTGSVGGPLILAAAGIALALIGAMIAFVAALRHQ